MPNESHPVEAVVLAAGLGTRMRSRLPKMLHTVLDRPLVAYPVEAALSVGARRVVVVVGHGAEEVEACLRARFGQKVAFARQAEPRGTADALRAALPHVTEGAERLLILNGDLPLIRQEDLLPLLARANEATLVFASFIKDEPTGYGRVLREGGKAVRVVEEKDASEEERKIKEVNAGIYLADRAFVESALSEIKTENAQREFYLPDLVALAASRAGALGLFVDPVSALGVNDRAELAEVEKHARRRRNLILMKAGVTLLDPERAYLSWESEFGEDVTIAPGVSIRGASRIGSGTTIGEGCVIRESEIGEGCELRPYCVLDRAKVEDGAIVGPFAHLRPKAHLGKRVHIGNFVEVKNTQLGEGSKANHLTYLGDAEIGAGVNVGAGTITCNYDGVGKYKTTIGDGVFIGSDVQLVAPVTVGRGAVIGAGSCVSEDVPEEALAITRAKQENREGGARRYWAKRKGKG